MLSREARVALTLRVVGGLTSDEIARAFLVPAATIQARITRAKKSLGAAGVPFVVPPAGERAERLGSVLSVIYLLPSVRGELLTRLGRYDEARVELEHAVALCGNERERAVLRRKIRYIASHG
jgi:predicted RNA polymerase sigma factor